MKTLHFKSKEAYRKWLAYEHIRTPTGKVAKAKKGRHPISAVHHIPKIVIAGRVHKVKHRRYL